MEKYVVNGEPHTKMLPSDVSLGEHLMCRLKDRGDSILMIDGVTGTKYTCSEAIRMSSSLASYLQKKGLQINDVVGVCCENRFEYLIVLLANLQIGAVLAPMNPLYSAGEVGHNFSITYPKIIFTSGLCLKNIIEAANNVKFVQEIINFDYRVQSDYQSKVPVSDYKQLIYSPPSKQISCAINPCTQTAVILSSSGTTGLPKGVMLSHNNIKMFLSIMRYELFNPLKENGKSLLLIPFFHGYGYGMLLTVICTDASGVIIPRFEEKLFLSSISNYKVTVMSVVPQILNFLLKHPLVNKNNMSSVTDLICGGAPCNEALLKSVKDKFNINVHQGYGMTETSVVVTFCNSLFNKFSSVGKILPGMKGKVLDLISQIPLGPNEMGELCFKGECVMQGYCNNTEATNEIIGADGWLHTGDIGYYDKEGFFYVLDRIKELIKYKAYQVPPAELEAVILSIPGVLDAAVVGTPHKEDGEHPTAFVVKDTNSKIDTMDIINYVKGKLSPQKWLRGGVRFVEIIPKNPGGKILRRVLREQLSTSGKSKL